MSNEERKGLIEEVEEIRSNIERLQPEYEQQVRLGGELESRRVTLLTLRRELARGMEALHSN